jgi:hypothetical protein
VILFTAQSLTADLPCASILEVCVFPNGQLGLGFSLGGLSVIHRCAKTIATDGVKGGVNYNNNDRYCLILEVCVFPYSKVCPDLVFTVQ